MPPIFDYLCKECGHTFEKIVLKTDSKVVCPECGSDNAEKLLAAAPKSGIFITGGQRFLNNGKTRHKGDW